jgi:hypothetical protein
MAGTTLDDLAEALAEHDRGAQARATSIRMSSALHRATAIAVELGMDASFSAATTHALAERTRSFLRQQAMAAHIARHPEDRPTLAAVASRRLSGTGHPAEARPELVARVAAHVEQREPRWLETALDATVDLVIDHVELLLREAVRTETGAA